MVMMIFPFGALATFLALTKDQNTLAIALLVPILGVLSPLLIGWQLNRNARRQKMLDWEREDKVAARAEAVAEKAAEAARLVIQRQVELDKKTDEVARQVAKSTHSTNTQLEKIHGLVNSQMTTAIRSELAATRDTLALMSELIEKYKLEGTEPSVAVLAAYKGREAKIKELEETLRIREEADAASKLVNVGPQEVIVVGNQGLLGVSVQEVAIKAENLTETPTPPTEVVIVNPEPVPVVDTHAPDPVEEPREVVVKNVEPVPVIDAVKPKTPSRKRSPKKKKQK